MLFFQTIKNERRAASKTRRRPAHPDAAIPAHRLLHVAAPARIPSVNGYTSGTNPSEARNRNQPSAATYSTSPTMTSLSDHRK